MINSALALLSVAGMTAINIYTTKQSRKLHEYTVNSHEEIYQKLFRAMEEVTEDTISCLTSFAKEIQSVKERIADIASNAEDCRKAVGTFSETDNEVKEKLNSIHSALTNIRQYYETTSEACKAVDEARAAIENNTSKEAGYADLISHVIPAMEGNAEALKQIRETMEQSNRQLSVLRNLMTIGKR